MHKEIKFREYGIKENEERPLGDFGTVAQLQEWADMHDIPRTAVIVYAGCGSHNIAFEWEVEIPDPLDDFEGPEVDEALANTKLEAFERTGE